MNGALYISFFQGQLESALEQVAQLAVQEITKTVGATLNSMLLETATKEQENQRLKSSLQARERGDAARTPKTRAPGRSVDSGGRSETLRREQKARAVGQLKAVMERVLEFAVCELSRIVEDSFDDLLSEFGKKEQENQRLKEQLRDESSTPEEAEEDDSPSGSRAQKTEPEDEKEAMDTSGGSETPTVISVAQDWVPILDKVFGQKWCSDLWQIKEEGGVREQAPLSGGGPVTNMDSLIRETLMPSCVASQLELEDAQLDTEALPLSCDKQAVPVVSSSGDESQIRSPSMLQRLLTLPSQLLEDDEEEEESMEATPGPDAAEPQEPKSPSARKQKTPREEVEEEDEELEETTRPRTRRKSHTCGDCGRKFSRAHLLRAHRQTHEEMPSRCPECGKSFSQSSRLQAHLRTHSGKTI